MNLLMVTSSWSRAIAGDFFSHTHHPYIYYFSHAFPCILLVLLSAPVFLTKPKKLTLIETGQNVKLFCKIKKSKNTTYKWYKDGKKLFTRRTKRMRVKRMKFLKIKKVNLKDGGNYMCVAKNRCGHANATIKLVVKGRLIFSSSSSSSSSFFKMIVINLVKKISFCRASYTYTDDVKMWWEQYQKYARDAVECAKAAVLAIILTSSVHL